MALTPLLLVLEVWNVKLAYSKSCIASLLVILNSPCSTPSRSKEGLSLLNGPNSLKVKGGSITCKLKEGLSLLNGLDYYQFERFGRLK